MRVELETIPASSSAGSSAITLERGERTTVRAEVPAHARLAQVVLRRLDGIFDAGATALALVVVGQFSWQVLTIVVASHLLLSLTNNQPMPFRLDQYFPWSSLVGPVVVAVAGLVAVTGWAPGSALVVAVATTAFCISGRITYVALVRGARRRRILREPALIVGTLLERLALREACTHHPEYGLDVVAEIGPVELRDALDQTADTRRRASRATALVVARGVTLTPELLGELRWAVTRGYRVLIETTRADREVPAGEVVHLASARIVSLPFAPLNYRSWLLKRGFDLAVASVLLVLLSPVLAAAAIGVRLSSPGPVIFRQSRVGRDGRLFTMYKFRTFPDDHVDDQFSLDHEECPLPFGRLLRRTSIDELPQLVNVLRGDMSIVGPRPERPHFADDLASEIPGYHERHRVPGGITGLAQVNGLWGNSCLHERVHFDNAYIDNWRLRRDFSILLKTLPATIRKGRG